MSSSQQFKKLRIVQVLPSLVSGGVERGTLDLCAYLIKQGHDAWVISSGGPLVNTLEECGAKHITLPVQSKNPLVMLSNSIRLLTLIKSHQFDIMHVRSRAPAWSCLWASKKSGIPLISTFHGQYGHQNKLKKIYNSAMLRGNTCIAVSQFIEAHIKHIYPNHLTNIKLIRRGIDLSYFSTSERTHNLAELKQRWGIQEHHKVIILPGRLTRIKGHQTFLNALTRLRHESISCLIIGDTPNKASYQKELLAFIESQKLDGIVKFTGNCSDMPSMYALADIVISASSKPESFGRIACEAQAMGCLVVATNHGGSLETVTPIQRQFMCDIQNSDSMANSILKALSYCQAEKQLEKQAIVDESRHYIEQNFSLERMCQETISLYNSLS